MQKKWHSYLGNTRVSLPTGFLLRFTCISLMTEFQKKVHLLKNTFIVSISFQESTHVSSYKIEGSGSKLYRTRIN